MNKISIIIPILNEEASIGQLLKHLQENSSKINIAEIIVVDGGSTDGSQDIVTKIVSGRAQSRPIDLSIALDETATVLLSSQKGRAKQMNHGADHATGSILYFLHADSLPPKNFDNHILNEVENGNNAGCFRIQFDSDHWWLKLAGWLTKFRWRACRGGDQSQFITKELFNNIGGFDESFIIYEDNILINELYKRNQFAVINKKLITSARRYQKHGIWKLQYHFWAIYVKKWFGASPDGLYAYYKKNIA